MSLLQVCNYQYKFNINIKKFHLHGKQLITFTSKILGDSCDSCDRKVKSSCLMLRRRQSLLSVLADPLILSGIGYP